MAQLVTGLVKGVNDYKFSIDPVNSRVFIYIFSENPDVDGKVGETYVPAGEDPLNGVSDRIKEQLTTSHHKWKNGTAGCFGVWDVTDLAIKTGKFRESHIYIDDYIRPHIGHIKPNSREWHDLPVDEIKYRVDKFLYEAGQPLPTASLNVLQAEKAELFLDKIIQGKQVLLAEFCARFGKTIWSASIVKEAGIPLTIYSSYVLTAGTSIRNELAGYEQFKDIVFVETSVRNYQSLIDDALTNGKQVVAFLSLCPGSLRQDRIDYLYGLDVDRLTFIDEADFGAHRSGQAMAMIDAQQPDDVVILMTGTNPDRAASAWKIDFVDTVVYPELLIEKRTVRPSYDTTLKYFTVDPERTKSVVDAEFYQLDLAGPVEDTKINEPDVFDDGGVFLPSWGKTVAKPVKAKRFLVKTLRSLFMDGDYDNLNVDLITERTADEGKRVAMMFFPNNTSNKNLKELASIAEDTLPGYRISMVYGADGMKGADAEVFVKEEIEKASMSNKHSLILAVQMAQRSFSIPQISELYLAYDNGDAGTTTQRISRALTAGMNKTLARIISLSFDPNRDDKFDAMILETAKSQAKNNGCGLKNALRNVLKTIDIYKSSEDGDRIKIEIDEYLEQFISFNRRSRIIGKTANLDILNEDQLAAIAIRDLEALKIAKTASVSKGKTAMPVIKPVKGNSNKPDDSTDPKDIISKVREVIACVAENIDFMVDGCDSTGDINNIDDALDFYRNNEVVRNEFKLEYNIEFELIDELFTLGVINKDLLDLKV
jgi:hypothetical protein